MLEQPGLNGYYWAKIHTTGNKGAGSAWMMTRVEHGNAYFEAYGDGKLVSIPCNKFSHEWVRILAPGKTVEEAHAEEYPN